MEEQSVYLIQPEAENLSSLIRAIIQSTGLLIATSRIIKMDEVIVRGMWPQMSDKLLRERVIHFEGRLCEAGIVTGKNVIARLMAIAGDKENPQDCGDRTIRFLCGSSLGIYVENQAYYWNGIWYAKDQDEVDRVITLFGFR